MLLNLVFGVIMMGEFGVSDKEAKKNSTSAIPTTTSVLGLGSVKVQKQQQQQYTLEAFPSYKTTTMMMLHHNHHHRPLSPFDNTTNNNSDFCAAGDGDGPTTQDTSLTNHHHHINAALSGVPALGATIDAVRPLQPFDNISAYTPATTTTTRSAFKSPAGGMAASLGLPFTSAQWKELQRQAMIYKYMMASVPVPPELLIPSSLTPASSRSHLDGGFNLRLSSSTDPEPGRCRRTDGKKWRCSRDVAPNHKYCERHMHRGRPRSRKPVEVHTTTTTTPTINSNINSHQLLKRARHDCDPFPTSGVTVAISNPTTRRDGSSSHFLAASTTTQPYLESSLSLDNFGVKAADFESVASVSSNKEPRGLHWMLNGDPISLGASESEWQSLMHNKVGLNAMSSCSDTESHYLNSFALYSTGLEPQSRRPAMFLNPLLVPMECLQSEKPRGFIDAWSNAATEQSNADNTNCVAPIGKLSLSSLDLSMGGGSVHEDLSTSEVGLGLMEPDGSTHNANDTKTNLSNWLSPTPWVAPTPGGPLAEVLRPSTVTATNDAASNSNSSSPVMAHAESTSSPLGGTMVSSPSGVLHKTLASLSDSSSNSSPTVASSRANSEFALLRFNQK